MSDKIPTVSIIVDPYRSAPIKHGLEKLKAALQAHGESIVETGSLAEARGATRIIAGLAESAGPAAFSVETLRGPESLLVRRVFLNAQNALLIVGSDERGLMYALLDVADRIGWAAPGDDPLKHVTDIVESPAVAERAVSKYTMHRHLLESQWNDEGYLSSYFDLLARSRFNTFVLILGYENWGYFTPPYPYFFDLPQFPDVRVIDLTPQQQKNNLDSLRRMIRMANERGVRFTLGIWEHIYRGWPQGPPELAQKPMPGLVWGVTAKNLLKYTTAALAKLLEAAPEINAIQFRIHDESGLSHEEMQRFWPEMFQVVKNAGRPIRADLRAKGLPDNIIDHAVKTGLDFRICTKYWAEQMGLPFHPTHINRQNQYDRRHGYADLLRYPKRYNMIWRLWNGGTARLLQWGSPDYARRFADTTHLYDGEGFELNEPLATKMQTQPHDAAPFEILKQEHRYYDYEFQRYWHLFQTFGRTSYNPDCPAEVWERPFITRFGPTAGPLVMRALHKASWILPRITTCIFPYHNFPMTRGWPEKQCRYDLIEYAAAEVSDTQQFLTIAQAAQLLDEGGESAKVWPQQTARWFTQCSEEVLALAAKAEKQIGKHKNREFESTIVDLRILGYLAQFHGRRIYATLCWVLYKRTGEGAYIQGALERERTALQSWQALVEAAGDFYHDDLMFGPPESGLTGHWRDELAILEHSVLDLETRRGQLGPIVPLPVASLIEMPGADVPPPQVEHSPIDAAPPRQALTIRATVRDPAKVKWVRLLYRPVNQMKDYAILPMHRQGTGDDYSATIPADQMPPDWDLMYLIEAMNNRRRGTIWPDFEKRTPYVVVWVGEKRK